MQNFCYIIGDRTSGQALVVDPAWEPEKILKEVKKEGFTLSGMIASHSHYDHLNAAGAILEKVDVPVLMNEREFEISRMGGDIFVDLKSAAKPVADNDEIRLGSQTLRFIHTPGHTPGGQCVMAGGYLITGDTLFIDGCGRYDLPGGNEEDLKKSLKRIALLLGSLVVYPGHDYGPVPFRKLEEEVKENPFLRE